MKRQAAETFGGRGRHGGCSERRLAGRRIAITGATGFLGTALTERVLRCLPETEVVVMVRPGRRGAKERVRP